VGFCKKCQHAVELNEKSSCPGHPKRKPIKIKYVLPKNLNSTLVEIEEEGAKQFKKTKRIWTIILIILVLMLFLCLVIPLLISSLPELFGLESAA